MPPIYQSSDYRRSLLRLMLSLQGKTTVTNIVVGLISLSILCWHNTSSTSSRPGESNNRTQEDSVSKRRVSMTRRASILLAQLPLFIQSLSPLKRRQRRLEPKEEPLDMTVMDHVGSCQCESVVYQITAPRTLRVEHEQDTGIKSTFPRTCVDISNFMLNEGSEHLKKYSAKFGDHVEQTNTFCGKCGTHLLCAYNDGSRHIYMNVLTLQSEWIPMPLSVDNGGSGSPASFVRPLVSSPARNTATSTTFSLQQDRADADETTPSPLSASSNSSAAEVDGWTTPAQPLHRPSSRFPDLTPLSAVQAVVSHHQSTAASTVTPTLPYALLAPDSETISSVASSSSQRQVSSGWNLVPPTSLAVPTPRDESVMATTTPSTSDEGSNSNDKDEILYSAEQMLYCMRKHLSDSGSKDHVVATADDEEEDASSL